MGGILVLKKPKTTTTTTIQVTPSPITVASATPTSSPIPSPTTIPTVTPLPTATASTVPAGLKNYQSQDMGISFNYPQDWQFEISSRQNNLVVGVDVVPPGYDLSLPDPNISLFYNTSYPFSMTPVNNSLMTDPQPIQVAGVTGIQMENKAALGEKYLPRAGGCPYIHEIQLPLKSGTLYIDSCVVSPDYTPQLQIILKSLQFI